MGMFSSKNKAGEAKQEKDVICGMMVDPDTAPARSVYKGKTYYFCAPGCKVTFEKDPEKYLASEK